ncbi:MAG: hypothetical protein OTI36_01305 [Beijerinckiaceae bacterium]|nr:hypothetical protein [Beijerinckiaceae bacterium]
MRKADSCELGASAADLGEGHEDGGRNEPARGMRPARQRLEAGQAPVGESDDRLVVNEDLPLLEGVLQLFLKPQLRHRCRHRRLALRSHRRGWRRRVAVDLGQGAAKAIEDRPHDEAQDGVGCREARGEMLGGHRQKQARLARSHARGARGVIQQRHLADDLARPEHGEDMLPRRAFYEHLDAALLDEIAARGQIACPQQVVVGVQMDHCGTSIGAWKPRRQS